MPKEFWELADSAYDHIGSILDKMTFEDTIKFMVYVNVTYFLYTMIHKTTVLFNAAKDQILLRDIPEEQARRMVLRWPYAPKPSKDIEEKIEQEENQVNWFIVQISLIIGYYIVYKPEAITAMFGTVKGYMAILKAFLGLV